MATSEKQRVALVSLVASAVLASAKLFAGLATGSLGILSEAIHSIIDFGATIITWVAVRWSDQPPDEEHHYGHAKAESVAALVETGLLFLTTGWIVWEAVNRLLLEEPHIDVTWWAVAIVAGSIVIDFNRARALNRVARATASEALAADALHFSSDMWSSLVVLGGLLAVAMGLPAADAVAAIAVSFFVALAGWRLGSRTLSTLLDAAPEGATEKIRSIVEARDGVLAVRRIRLRPAGSTLFAGVVVEVARAMPVDEMVSLKARIQSDIHGAFPHADITVTVNPVTPDDETIFQKVIMIAGRRGIAIHHLNVQHFDGRLAVSFDLEVDGETSLAAAHETATRLENAIRRELGAGVEVESHIEPQPERLLEGTKAPARSRIPIEKSLGRLCAREKRLSDLHNIRVRDTDHGMFVHYHCRFRPEDTVDQVHAAVDRIESALRSKFPSIRRVIAHTEPVGRARHRL